MNNNMRSLALALCLAAGACLSACGMNSAAAAVLPDNNTPAPAEISSKIEEESAVQPVAAEERFSAEIGGEVLSSDTVAVNFGSVTDEDIARLAEIRTELSSLKSVTVDSVLLPVQINALKAGCPGAEINYSAVIFGEKLGSDSDTLILPASFNPETDADELKDAIELLPGLKLVDTVAERSFDEAVRPVEELCAIREILPEDIELRCSFELFGKTVSSEDAEICYEKAGLGDADIEQLKTALPLLSSCTRFVLDNCGPSYETLAQLRDEFPERGIVWRVHFMADSILTDAKVLWTVYLNNSNCHVLDYCTELEYIDLGHDDALSDISFTAFMPKLKVLIIALTPVRDISALANCPELEYLEVFYTNVTDLSPLASCTKLEHLNISTLKVNDITPLYGLTNLKRLWMLNGYYVPQEQKDKIAELMPDCVMQFRLRDGDLTGYGWRRFADGTMHERYALLREQIGYADYNSPADKIDYSKSWQRGYA